MTVILFFLQKSGFWNIFFKIYYVSKFIPAAKSENFVDTLRPQKPTWTKFWKSKNLKNQSYRYYHEKTQVGPTLSLYLNLTMKLLIKSKNSPKNKAKMKFYIFWEVVSQFCFRWALHPFQLHSVPRYDAD